MPSLSLSCLVLVCNAWSHLEWKTTSDVLRDGSMDAGNQAEGRDGMVEDDNATYGLEKKTTTIRTVTEVLMMGGAKKTPPVRKRIRAKRGCRTKALGNIRKFFPNAQIPKECKLDDTRMR